MDGIGDQYGASDPEKKIWDIADWCIWFIQYTASPESNIDILVTFQEGQETFDNYMDLKFYLEDSFNKKVDLVIEDSIKTRLKDRIMRETVFA